MKLTYPQEEVEVLDELEGDVALERDALVCDVRVQGGVLELDALEEDVLMHDELPMMRVDRRFLDCHRTLKR